MDPDETVIRPKKREAVWSIRWRDTSRAGETMVIEDGFTVGRATQCDLILEEELVSRHHATFFLDGDRLFVEDNNSTNGTFVNDVLVDRAKLEIGDIVFFDEACFEICQVSDAVSNAAKNNVAPRADTAQHLATEIRKPEKQIAKQPILEPAAFTKSESEQQLSGQKSVNQEIDRSAQKPTSPGLSESRNEVEQTPDSSESEESPRTLIMEEDRRENIDKQRSDFSGSSSWESAEVSDEGTIILNSKKKSAGSKSRKKAKRPVVAKRKRDTSRSRAYPARLVALAVFVALCALSYTYREQVIALVSTADVDPQAEVAWTHTVGFDSVLYGPLLGSVRGDNLPDVILANDDGLLIFDVSTGENKGQIELLDAPISKPILIESQGPESLIFLVSDTRTASILDSAGTTRWETNLGRRVTGVPAPSVHHVRAMSASIYVPTKGRGLIALDATNGEISWDSAEVSDSIVSSNLALSASDDVIYFAGGSGAVEAISLTTSIPALLWSSSLGSGVVASQVLVSGNVVFGVSSDGDISAINRQHGELIWRQKLAVSVAGEAAIFDDHFYVFDREGVLHKLEAGTGQILSQVNLGLVVTAPIEAVKGDLLVFDNQGRFSIVSKSNEIVLQQKVSGAVAYSGPMIVKDVDGDGSIDILSLSENGVLSQLKLNR